MTNLNRFYGAPPIIRAMLDRRLSGAALLLLPTGLMAYLAFNAGGYFPTAEAFVAVVLAVVLALRMVASETPLEGWNPWLAVGAGSLVCLALLTLVSELWSHAPELALLAFDLALLYALTTVLFGSLGHTRTRLRWMLRFLAVGIFVVCTISLITRLLPHVWPIAPDMADDRLSYPVTYWNVLGLLAVFGILLCANFASRGAGSLLVRAGGAAALPVLASALYFTFSRGSIGVCLIGLVVYLLIARPRGIFSAVLSAGLATAIAVKVDYGAKLLATPHATAAGAVAQGHHAALVVLACALGAGVARAALGLLVDRPLRRVRLKPSIARRASRAGWAALGAGSLIALVALSGQISHEYQQFLKPPSAAAASDYRNRLTNLSNNGRVELWRIAWHQFEAKPLLGQGAGTFQEAFLRYRTTDQYVVNAHSLYLETLDELGIVGLVLLLAAILSILVRTAMRARGADRPLYAVVFALILAWAIESGIDWDWQMPVVTLVVFALGGAVLAQAPATRRRAKVADATSERSGVARVGHRRRGQLTPPLRVALGVVCLLLAVAPAYVWLSQRKLNQADLAFGNGNYRTATADALSSVSILGIRPEAYELIAYCDLHRDMPRLAIKAIDKAMSLDPDNWNYTYDLALMKAAAGENPLPEARRALLLDPREPLVQQEWETFKAEPPSRWPSAATSIADAFASL
jgi:tetratricopeptide (TPR) repeat protein